MDRYLLPKNLGFILGVLLWGGCLSSKLETKG